MNAIDIQIKTTYHAIFHPNRRNVFRTCEKKRSFYWWLFFPFQRDLTREVSKSRKEDSITKKITAKLTVPSQYKELTSNKTRTNFRWGRKYRHHGREGTILFSRERLWKVFAKKVFQRDRNDNWRSSNDFMEQFCRNGFCESSSTLRFPANRFTRIIA